MKTYPIARWLVLSLTLVALDSQARYVAADDCCSGCRSTACCDAIACDEQCDGRPCGCESCCDGCDDCRHDCLLGSCLGGNDCCPRPCTYWSLFGGWSNLGDYTGESPIAPDVHIGSFNDGWVTGIARGRRLGERLRGEAEFAFRSNSAAVWDVNGAIQDWDGDLHTYFGMANLYYDFNCFDSLDLTPYIGGGIGLAIFDADINTAILQLELDDEAFAFQAMAGLTKRLSQKVDGFVEYRYVGTTDVQLNRRLPAPQLEFGDFDGQFHNVLFGLRIWR